MNTATRIKERIDEISAEIKPFPRAVKYPERNTSHKNIVENNIKSQAGQRHDHSDVRSPILSPMMAPDPVASITEVPKITQVIGITILIPASASEPA